MKKDIKPIILDYDQTNNKLNVVDRSFLIWLGNQEREDLLELANFSNDKARKFETSQVEMIELIESQIETL